jgi:anti-sigma regulatory factor (Ser/Thr protein kinase)
MQDIGSLEVFDYVSTVTHPEAKPTLRFRLRATPSSLSAVRAEVRSWLSELGASTDEILDVQLACSEVLSMVIEQATTPVALIIDVEGKLESDTVTITIREYGLCRAGGEESAGHQPLALALIQALVDVFDVQAHTDGRTIVLGRRLHPPPI